MRALVEKRLSEKPDERRIQHRERHFVEDNLLFQSDDLTCEGKILDLTTQGSLFLTSPFAKLTVGDDLGTLNVTLNGSKIARIPRVFVRHLRRIDRGVLVGVEFRPPESLPENRKFRVFERASIYHPTDAKVVVNHPINFADEVLFRIEDVSLDGMRLSASLRNRFILPGMQFKDAKISLGQFETIHADFEVVFCRIDNSEERLIVGVKIHDSSSKAKQLIAGFVVTNSTGGIESRLSRVKAAGFEPKRLKNIVRYTHASTMQHFMDLQILRWNAYASAGKIDAQTVLPEEMIDEYDQRSKIVLGYIGQDLVCSVRITECKHAQDKFEMESVVDFQGRYDRLDTLEISRLCVVPLLHGTDIVHGMIEHAARIFVQSGKAKLITSCTEDLIEFYERIGYKKIGMEYRLPKLNNSLHYVIEVSPRPAVDSAGVNPLYWALTYSRVHEFLISRGYAKNSGYTKVKIGAFKLLSRTIMALMSLRASKIKK